MKQINQTTRKPPLRTNFIHSEEHVDDTALRTWVEKAMGEAYSHSVAPIWELVKMLKIKSLEDLRLHGMRVLEFLPQSWLLSGSRVTFRSRLMMFLELSHDMEQNMEQIPAFSHSPSIDSNQITRELAPREKKVLHSTRYRDDTSLRVWLEEAMGESYSHSIVAPILELLKDLHITSLEDLRLHGMRVLDFLPQSGLSLGPRAIFRVRLRVFLKLPVDFGCISAVSPRNQQCRTRYLDPSLANKHRFLPEDKKQKQTDSQECDVTDITFELELSGALPIKVKPICSHSEKRWIFPVPVASEEWLRLWQSYQESQFEFRSGRVRAKIMMDLNLKGFQPQKIGRHDARRHLGNMWFIFPPLGQARVDEITHQTRDFYFRFASFISSFCFVRCFRFALVIADWVVTSSCSRCSHVALGIADFIQGRFYRFVSLVASSCFVRCFRVVLVTANLIQDLFHSK